MSAISGIEGLRPTINIIKKTKRIAIANKVNNLWMGINSKELRRYKTEFIPATQNIFRYGQ